MADRKPEPPKRRRKRKPGAEGKMVRFGSTGTNMVASRRKADLAKIGERRLYEDETIRPADYRRGERVTPAQKPSRPPAKKPPPTRRRGPTKMPGDDERANNARPGTHWSGVLGKVVRDERPTKNSGGGGLGKPKPTKARPMPKSSGPRPTAKKLPTPKPQTRGGGTTRRRES